ncbi:type 1 fimbrial protein [Shewanella sp. VB17]|uniref:fimbrial protein n=1 Tax=Shewanella sp. VB17 TaxID=2739432 RepID=UPI001563D1C6|nr:fimbrial protein [Shewanella sp. VB17]NRD74187.1 type 1 fimbrial protein [Shewanella sp. VB17]
MTHTNTVLKFSLLALSLGMMSSAAQAAVDGQVQITGSINSGTCDVLPENQNVEVALGSVGVDTFAAGLGTNSTLVPFDITLTDCVAGNNDEGTPIDKVAITFSGMEDSTVSGLGGLIAAGGPDTAQGVGVRLFDNDGSTKIGINDGISYNQQTMGGVADDIIMNFFAAYEATGAGNLVKAGNANSVAQFELTYL